MSKKSKLLSFTRNKTAQKVLLGVLIVLAAFFIGRQTAPHTSSSNPDKGSLNFQSASGGKGASSQTSMMTQTQQAAREAGLQPSNGHINLSGVVTEVDTNNISVKAANGQVITMSVDQDVVVSFAHQTTAKSGSVSTHQTVKDIKKDSKVTLFVTVYSDGTFTVRNIRVYGQ